MKQIKRRARVLFLVAAMGTAAGTAVTVSAQAPSASLQHIMCRCM